ncbi:MAG: alkaline phosphatase [Acidobacteria bacterium]|nr:alkaline phosphatase [Acidobacteriota bacterium]
MTMNRRLFLGTSARAGLVLPFARALPVLGQEQVFAHGVASGDPLADRVLLWTRVSGSSDDRVAVRWQVARDPGMQEVVAEGEGTTGPGRDYTFKATAPGLNPGTTYHYRFEALGERSPVGRTKTLPRNTDHVRLAFVSCSNLPFGYFNVYRRIAERDDLDAVLHLGDYLYEYPNRGYGDGTRFGHAPRPDKEITTLSDYRTRHAQYKSDADLQEVHRLHPFVCVWDDHEITNNAYTDGAQNHQIEDEEGDWFVRRTAAVKAYFEWMPIREPEPWPSQRTYRTFRFGKLLDLIMLDTRLIGRSRQAEWGDVEGMRHPDRTLLGDRQERWLYGELAAAKAAGMRWPVLGQQVMMGPMLDADGNPQNPDQWDGYEASRDRLFDFLESERIGNLVVLTGDVHQSWGMDVPRNPLAGYDPDTGAGSYGVDFVTTAVSSPSSKLRRLGTEEAIAAEVREELAANPHKKFGEAFHRGYCVLDLKPDRIQNDWYFVPTVEEKTDQQRWAAGIRVASGTQHGVRADGPA